jgi:UDP-glucose:(heptosyl)LPS alpha-1,3-glucosyltransferase
MNTALVVHDFDPGLGQGRYAVEIAQRLSAKLHLTVCANRFAVPPAPDVTFQRIPAWQRSALLKVLSFPRCADRLLAQRGYDLVHAQGYVCHRAEIITAHICNAARETAGGATDARGRRFARIAAALERRQFRSNPHARLIAVSQRVANEITEHYGWRGETTVIHHGVDSNAFRPPASESEKALARRQFGLPENGWTWLFVGEAVKGLRRVLGQLPHFPDARLLAISRSRLAVYRDEAQSLGVTGRVQFHGPSEDLPAAYRAADVLVYPSEYDAFGMVVAEAMAAGLPVIAGRNIGAAEWIEPGRNGLLCDPADAESLKRALTGLESDRERAAAIGQAARRTAEQHTWDACAEATLEVYEKAFARRWTG